MQGSCDLDKIEEGFKAAVACAKKGTEGVDALSPEIHASLVPLISRLAAEAATIVPTAGLSMMLRGKQDGKGELYDTVYFDQKMLILGKTDPMPYRPDDTTKKVDSQYLVLGEDGIFSELMYSSDGFLIDVYKKELSAEDAVSLYGLETVVMLYKAVQQFALNESGLHEAMGKVLDFLLAEELDAAD
ncbi:hypothetical protein [Methanogenium sp. MK-MG]|uniref:hypothetical protein n=1 Tax=Methanogenium sp. MK-MG TaxID=2599926 RepID=UPI0013EDD66A|nr:hypothetical protein [Methanogenium sp. MK-MG]KAF1076177.1 hypothetical protein MKMG_01549 [Methanogenium sp. MK-MG]